jgi:hypothetical protein
VNLDAALFRGTNITPNPSYSIFGQKTSDSVNRNDLDARLANEPARNKGSEIREHRQKRLPDSQSRNCN